MTSVQLQHIIEQSLQLSPQEQLQLAERMIAAAKNALPVQASQPQIAEGEHWGQNLVRLLEELGPIEMMYPEIEDPVEWVKRIRQDDADRLKPYWDGDK